MHSRGSEQREHIRYNVALPAKLSTQSLGVYDTQMADFCLGGMLIQLFGESEILATALKLNDLVSVAVPVEGLRGKRLVTLNAKIIRINAVGLGLQFEQPDSSSLLAVQNHVMQILHDDDGQSPLVTKEPVSEEQKQAALKATRKILEAFLDERLSGFLPSSQQAMLDAAEKMPTNQQQQPYFEAHKMLSRTAANICDQVQQLSAANLDAMENGTQLDASTTFSEQGNKLSLVDKDMFEDWLTLKVMATRAEGQVHDELLHLQLRFDRLFGISLSARRNPLHPAFICNAFGKALQQLPLEGRTDKVLMDVFDELVVSQLEVLYQQCNEILENSGVLQDLDVANYLATHYGHVKSEDILAKPKVKPAAVPEEKEPVEVAEPATETEAEHQHGADHASEAQSQQDLQENTEQPSESQAVSMAGAEPSLGASNQGQVAGVRTSLAARQFELQQHIAKHAYETAQRLLSSSYITSVQRRARSIPKGEILPHAEPQQVESALQELQQVSEVSEQPLSDRVLDAIKVQVGQAANIDHDLAAAIEIIQHLFEGILSNPAISPDAKKSIKRLELPFLRLMIKDNAFLEDEQHPARLLLNKMAKLGGRGSANLQQHEQEIEEQATHISTAFHGDSSVFVDALDHLKGLADAQEKLYLRNLKRVTEKNVGQQKLNEARQQAGEALEQRLGGKQVPKAILSLVDAGWRQLLVQTLLREGENSPDWQEFLGVIDHMLKAVDKLPDSQALQGVLASIKKGLKLVDETQVSNPRLLAELRNFLSAKVRQQQTVKLVDVPTGMLAKVEAEAIPGVSEVSDDDKPLERRWIRRAQSCQEGDCFNYIDQKQQEAGSTESVVVRLAWRDLDGSRFVFVNHQGMQVMEFSQQRFAEHLRDEHMTPAEDDKLPAVNRGLEEMVQRVYSQMAHQAIHDELTGKLNRREFERRLRHELTEKPSLDGTLIHLDIDQFNLVNNLGGPEAGDELIRQFSQMLKDVFPGVLCCRSGGDEFTLWLPEVSREGGRRDAESFCKRISFERFVCLDNNYSITCSSGVAHREANQESADDLIRFAEEACHLAKQQGRNRTQVYEQDDQAQHDRQDIMTWVSRLNQALDEDRLLLRCQRIEPASAGAGLPSYEVLISIATEEGDEIPPAYFLKAAEQYNRMQALDRWIIENVLRWMHSNPEVLSRLDYLSINLSGQSLNDNQLLNFIFDTFDHYPVPRNKLCFEVTETAAIANIMDAADFIREMQEIGCRFSLDDFGSGLASYGHLKTLPVDHIKIDGTFIRGLNEDEAGLALVKSINEMGHLMEKKTIAENVESDDVREQLKDIGIDFVQGYGIETPRKLDSLIQ